MRQVVILAGGQGTRLRERLGDLPKPLIDVCGMPLLEHQIRLVKKYGFDRVLVLVNYQRHKIIEFCCGHNNWGITVDCINDGDEPLGTAGAVLKIKDLLEEEFLVMYGDTMLNVDLGRFVQFHHQHFEAAATLFLHPNDHPCDSDLVELDNDGFIKNFHPYPHPKNTYYPNLVNAALYCIRKNALEFRKYPINEPLDFGKNLFPDMLRNGLLLRGYNSPEYIKDCGTPKRLDKVCADFASGKIERDALVNKQKAIFIDRDGTLNREVNHLIRTEQFELLPGTELAIEKINKSEYKTCVITNQPVIARGECSEDELKKIHNKMETLLGNSGAFLDRIYYCPHHPDRGYTGERRELKISCKCRKPGTEMINRAINDLNIDLKASWLIGDSTTDMKLANNAGLRSVLVQTGHAGIDGKYLVYPDYILPTFSDAVDFILDKYPVILDQVYKTLSGIASGDIVMIGGQSRSGKSSMANIFKAAIEGRGFSCKVISTDRWLLSLDKRGDSFLNKHDLEGLKNLIMLIKNRKKQVRDCKIPFYKKESQLQVPDAEDLTINPEDVIVLEGVATSLICGEIEDSKNFYIEIDESERRKRVIEEYVSRGMTAQAASYVYSLRLSEEFLIIKKFSDNATRLSFERLLGGAINDNK